VDVLPKLEHEGTGPGSDIVDAGRNQSVREPSELGKKQNE